MAGLQFPRKPAQEELETLWSRCLVSESAEAGGEESPNAMGPGYSSTFWEFGPNQLNNRRNIMFLPTHCVCKDELKWY